MIRMEHDKNQRCAGEKHVKSQKIRNGCGSRIQHAVREF